MLPLKLTPTGRTSYSLTDEFQERVSGYPWVDAGTQAYVTKLGTFDTTSPWVFAGGLLPADHILVTGGKDFWLLEGTFSGPGLFPEGAWVFTMADPDLDGIFDEGADRFAPQTTASVPEPATLFLLGSGLAGLTLLGRRKLRKR